MIYRDFREAGQHLATELADDACRPGVRDLIQRRSSGTEKEPPVPNLPDPLPDPPPPDPFPPTPESPPVPPGTPKPLGPPII
jgi:hypothetical protein